MPADKKVAKKEVIEKYFQGTGRRKQSVARVKVFVASRKKDPKTEPDILVNKKPYKDYFALSELREIAASPLKAVSAGEVSNITVVVQGGGVRGQAEAIRLGIARALVALNDEFKKTLKDIGYLTRDARVTERKKAGLKKARRAPQFSKR